MTSREDLSIITQSVSRYAEQKLVPALEQLNHYPMHPLPEGLVEGLRELGLFELLVPEARGGGGADHETLAAVLATLSQSAAAPATLLLTHTLAQSLVLESSNEAAHELGSDGALFGYPIYGETVDLGRGVRFRSELGRMVLDGKVEMVVNAPIADTLLVGAYDSDGGLVLVAVDTNAAGVSVGEPLLTLGMRGCPTADVSLREVTVEPGRLVAAPPGAGELLTRVTRRFRGPAAAIVCGVLGASLQKAKGYAAERYQGGHNIIDHQQVRVMLHEMLADEQLCRDAVRQLSTGEGVPHESASLYIRAREAAARATQDGVQLLGGYGYMEDYGQERCMRDAKQAQCLLGRTEVLRQELMEDWVAAEVI